MKKTLLYYESAYNPRLCCPRVRQRHFERWRKSLKAA